MKNIVLLILIALPCGCWAQTEMKQTELVIAIRMKNLNSALELIDELNDLNFTTGSGETPLSIAVSYFPEEALLKKLVLKGGDPDVADRNGVFVLEKLISDGKMSLASWFMERGASAHFVKTNNQSEPAALFVGRYARDFRDIRQFNNSGGNICATNKRGKSAIEMAILFRNNKAFAELLEWVLPCGWDINNISSTAYRSGESDYITRIVGAFKLSMDSRLANAISILDAVQAVELISVTTNHEAEIFGDKNIFTFLAGVKKCEVLARLRESGINVFIKDKKGRGKAFIKEACPELICAGQQKRTKTGH